MRLIPEVVPEVCNVAIETTKAKAWYNQTERGGVQRGVGGYRPCKNLPAGTGECGRILCQHHLTQERRELEYTDAVILAESEANRVAEQLTKLLGLPVGGYVNDQGCFGPDGEGPEPYFMVEFGLEEARALIERLK